MSSSRRVRLLELPTTHPLDALAVTLHDHQRPVSINTPLDVDPTEALAACAARGDLAARWYLRARDRGEAVSEEHARTVADLEAGRAASPAPLAFDLLDGG